MLLFDGQRLLADARKICETAIAFWHGQGQPPFDRYLFMLSAVHDGYGGLEHRNSDRLNLCPQRFAAYQRAAHQRRLHHAVGPDQPLNTFMFWNVKRLRARANLRATTTAKAGKTTPFAGLGVTRPLPIDPPLLRLPVH